MSFDFSGQALTPNNQYSFDLSKTYKTNQRIKGTTETIYAPLLDQLPPSRTEEVFSTKKITVMSATL